MASNATCPVCDQTFSFKEINTHIDRCLSGGGGAIQDSSSCPDAQSAEVDRLSPAGKRKRMEKKQDSQDTNDLNNQPKKRCAWGSLMKSPAATKSCRGKDGDRKGQGSHELVSTKDLSRGLKGELSSGSAKKSSSQKPKEIPANDVINQSLSRKHNSNESHISDQPRLSMTPPTVRNSSKKPDFRPLPERMRPQCLDDYIGQGKAVGRNSMLRRLLEADEVPSMILWGPPGCGKTTLANIIAQRAKSNGRCRFVTMSATTSNVAQVKEAIGAAKNEQKMFKRKTILFIDEIHRFNKLQQDAFLPHVENGTITLIGATTENPSFKVNSALLSRCRVVVLDKLSVDDLTSILERALVELGVEVLPEDEKEPVAKRESGGKRTVICIERYAITTLANLCDGDARAALNALHMTVQSQLAYHNSTGCASTSGSNKDSDWSSSDDDAPMGVIKPCHVKEGLQRSHVQYDRMGDEHYNCISALHKSMRGSDANAALYWMARMLMGGEDPLYVARRLIEFASADIGLADPQALVQAVSTFQACQFLGMPVCEGNLAQCVIYLSKAPKSHMVETVYHKVKKSIENHEGPMPGVPLHLRNASTELMRKLGYGKGYDPSVKQQYLPDCLKRVNLFEGTEYEFS